MFRRSHIKPFNVWIKAYFIKQWLKGESKYERGQRVPLSCPITDREQVLSDTNYLSPSFQGALKQCYPRKHVGTQDHPKASPIHPVKCIFGISGKQELGWISAQWIGWITRWELSLAFLPSINPAWSGWTIVSKIGLRRLAKIRANILMSVLRSELSL